MMKVTDEQIELLVKTLHDTETTKNDALAALIGEGETLEFYRGLVTGLVISHQLLMAFSSEDKNLAQWLSLAAALASEQYLNQKQNDELIFPDWIDA